MILYNRTIEPFLEEYLSSDNHKIVFIWGPRRSGKTTILRKISERLKVPLFNFDLQSERDKFLPERAVLKKIADSGSVILIDEVQNYPEATIALKILHDEFKVKIIATGSSELRRKSKNFDTLAGRFIEFHCLPLSLEEIYNNNISAPHAEKEFWQQTLEKIVGFGSYPELFDPAISENIKVESLQNILSTYVLKDVINIYELRNAKLAADLLLKIALQVGQEVSIRELASSLGASAPTIANYLEIFVKNYILIALPSFKTNLRRAVSAHKKYYFLDLGLRNALLKDYRPLNLRPDKGNIFENFIISELYKKIVSEKILCSLYFYREYNGAEVDVIIENYQKNYTCLEIKLNIEHSSDIFPLPHQQSIVNQNNYFEVLQTISSSS
jgi:hypothetical protein